MLYLDRRKDSQGYYYSFNYRDPQTGKRIRLKKSAHPRFENYDEAKAWAKSQTAYEESQKDKIEKKLSWKKKHYNFEDLLKRFETEQKRTAPNSYKTNIQYLEQYIFPYFLNTRVLPNINNWYLHFSEFRNWLEVDARTINSNNRKLAYSTINNIIHSLNRFMEFLKDYNLIDVTMAVKCKAFPDHLKGARSLKDVVHKAEYETIEREIRKIDPSVADFYCVLFYTGLRFNECMGLSISSIYGGEIEDAIGEELESKKIKYYGYLLVDSQPARDDKLRDDSGHVPRKPLKGRKTISHKNSRLVPLMDKTAFNILVTRYKTQEKAEALQKYGTDRANYLLFGDDIKPTYARDTLIKAYENCKMTFKTYHCLRHSFATRLVGETRSFFLAKAILGHKKVEVFERYLHLHEQIVSSNKNKKQKLDLVI